MLKRWFCAHGIMVLIYTDGPPQQEFTIWENVYLINADSEDEAASRAEAIGRMEQEAGETSATEEEGRPARWRFLGIRKVIACENADEQPVDSIEVTYSTFQVCSLGEAQQIAEGNSVALEYVD
jgi:hypothetical protein